MKTFHVQTLGCKVNQYESDRVRALLQTRGLTEAPAAMADIRIVNSCSVTMDAASQSRQTARRFVRLPVCGPATIDPPREQAGKVVVMGCWATEDPLQAALPGVDAVLTHADDVPARLNDLLDRWLSGSRQASLELPQLTATPAGRQRAVLKVQDGCDAYCTYCIIPRLRPRLLSRSIDELTEEAQALVAAGHIEIVLTGIFLGAYGRETAVRRRQSPGPSPLAALVDSLCSRVRGLKRLRLSSLEPGDLSDELLSVLRSHTQVVPHFHLPLQSGSDLILRRMNRQYTRSDFLGLLDKVRGAFDLPALTSDVIVGFPGEDDAEFEQTLDVVRQGGFIHVHAFPYSPRPGTAAARWTDSHVTQTVTHERMKRLRSIVAEQDESFRRNFVGRVVGVIVENDKHPRTPTRRGRCERYFQVEFPSAGATPGDLVDVRVDLVIRDQTFGTAVD